MHDEKFTNNQKYVVGEKALAALLDTHGGSQMSSMTFFFWPLRVLYMYDAETHIQASYTK